MSRTPASARSLSWPRSTPHSVTPGRIAVLLLLLAACGGCDREIDTTYAAVRGDSINGIAAFVQLLRDTGHTVTARQQLPAEIDADVTTLVVFDHSFTGLEPDTGDLLMNFASSQPDRTLLLVLRDSDCVVDYLRAVLARDDLSPDRRSRAETLLADFEEVIDFQTSAPRAATDPFADGLEVVRRDRLTESIEVRVLLRVGPPRTTNCGRLSFRLPSP